MDGVLEVKKAHFWFISLDKPAGFFHIRVNRNAEPQFVLAEVIKKVTNSLQSETESFIWTFELKTWKKTSFFSGLPGYPE